MGEGEVAEADRGEGLDGEVDRLDQREVAAVGLAVGEPQDDRRDDQHRQREHQGDHHRAVGPLGERAAHPPQVLAHRAAALLRRPLRLGRVGQLRVGEFLGLAEQRHPVAGRDAEVPPRADDQLAVRPHHPDRDEVPEQLAQGAGAADPDLRRDEALLPQHHVVRAAVHAGVDHRGREEPRHVQRRPLAGRLFHRPADGRVVEVGDDLDVGAQIPRHQRRLDVPQVAAAGADDRPRPRQPGPPQLLLQRPARADVGAAPAFDPRGVRRGGVVVDDRHRHPGRAQLLHRAQPDPLEAADDHVAAPVRGGVRCGDGAEVVQEAAQSSRAAAIRQQIRHVFAQRMASVSCRGRRKSQRRSRFIAPREGSARHRRNGRARRPAAAAVPDRHLRRHRRPRQTEAPAGDAAPLPVGADAGIPRARHLDRGDRQRGASARSSTTPARSSPATSSPRPTGPNSRAGSSTSRSAPGRRS